MLLERSIRSTLRAISCLDVSTMPMDECLVLGTASPSLK